MGHLERLGTKGEREQIFALPSHVWREHVLFQPKSLRSRLKTEGGNELIPGS